MSKYELTNKEIKLIGMDLWTDWASDHPYLLKYLNKLILSKIKEDRKRIWNELLIASNLECGLTRIVMNEIVFNINK